MIDDPERNFVLVRYRIKCEPQSIAFLIGSCSRFAKSSMVTTNWVYDDEAVTHTVVCGTPLLVSHSPRTAHIRMPLLF